MNRKTLLITCLVLLSNTLVFSLSLDGNQGHLTSDPYLAGELTIQPQISTGAESFGAAQNLDMATLSLSSLISFGNITEGLHQGSVALPGDVSRLSSSGRGSYELRNTMGWIGLIGGVLVFEVGLSLFNPYGEYWDQPSDLIGHILGGGLLGFAGMAMMDSAYVSIYD